MNFAFPKLKISNRFFIFCRTRGFPGRASGKESTCQWRRPRDVGLIPELESSPGEGNGSPLQYSCLENSMDRGALQATVHGTSKRWGWLSTHTQNIQEIREPSQNYFIYQFTFLVDSFWEYHLKTWRLLDK